MHLTIAGDTEYLTLVEVGNLEVDFCICDYRWDTGSG